MFNKKLSQKGFSLVELMIVVGIIGILATLAVPRFRAFQAKARQSEVRTTLNHIYTLQEVRFQEANAYVQLQPSGAATGYGHPGGTANNGPCDFTAGGAQFIGFRISPCNAASFPRYRYLATTNAAFTTFDATGTGLHSVIYPGCAGTNAELWTMNQDHVLTPPPVSGATGDSVSVCQ